MTTHLRSERLRLPRVDSLAEVLTPARRQRVEVGCAPHALDVVSVAGEEPRNLGHTEPMYVPLQLDNGVSRGHLALAGDSEVEAE